MGKRGPAPKPTALKKLQGNPGRRPLPKGEPMPETRPEAPRAPRGMSKAANKAWRELAPALHAARLLTVVDELALRLLVETWADYQEACELIAEEGLVAVTDKGYSHQHAAVGIRNNARAQLAKLMREFGMTPSGRTGIRLPGAGEEQAMGLADMLFAAVNESDGD